MKKSGFFRSISPIREPLATTETWSSGIRWAAQAAPISSLPGPTISISHTSFVSAIGQRLALVAPAVLLDQLAADADGLAGRLCPFEHQPGQIVAVDQPLLADQLVPAAKGRFADGQLVVVHDAVDAGDVAERLGHLRESGRSACGSSASSARRRPLPSESPTLCSPGLCFAAGTIVRSVPFSWLSQVCEVITDPSTDALQPTMIDVQQKALAARNAQTTPTTNATLNRTGFDMMQLRERVKETNERTNDCQNVTPLSCLRERGRG